MRRSASDPARAPDEGEPQVHPTAGAVAVGARFPLIAYNVNLESNDLELAKRIAAEIRERDGGLPISRRSAWRSARRGPSPAHPLAAYPLTVDPPTARSSTASRSR